MKRYFIEEIEQYVPITLDRLVEGHAIPFEVFTDDGGFKKSLFDIRIYIQRFCKRDHTPSRAYTILHKKRQ